MKSQKSNNFLKPAQPSDEFHEVRAEHNEDEVIENVDIIISSNGAKMSDNEEQDLFYN